jgi:small-conductance mechanosensitive channel
MKISSRIVRIIILLIGLCASVYFRFFHDFIQPPNKLKIIYILLALAVLLLLFKFIIEVMALWYRIDKKHGSGRLRDNLIVGLSNLFSIFSVIAVVLGILAIFGLRPSEVFTSLSIVAAALAIISKDFISEIIIGILNGFSSKIELDDYIKVGNQKGKIIDIGLQKVALLSDDEDIIYIPNLKFYNEEIINYTKRDIRQASIEFHVDPKHITNLKELEAKLCESLYAFEADIEPNSHELKVINIDKENIELKFQYTLKFLSQESQRKIRKSLMRKLLDTITENNIANRNFLIDG